MYTVRELLFQRTSFVYYCMINKPWSKWLFEKFGFFSHMGLIGWIWLCTHLIVVTTPAKIEGCIVFVTDNINLVKISIHLYKNQQIYRFIRRINIFSDTIKWLWNGKAKIGEYWNI